VRKLIPSYAVASVAGFVLLLGLIGLVEMTYQIEVNKEQSGTAMSLFGVAFDAADAMPWAVAVALLLAGAGMLKVAIGMVRHAWADVTVAINARKAA
jgi:branched-chain amino acid transport system permease protein